ncbi:hypothetical protein EYF80_062454 [Liparis tanakae]|uniref:Uncharacterized protein n=1 Tax=Liparis tanakae TaxID=230148 RepID=A0A4Z2EFC7_9TELE|nr:hypothetical protein EYF80_062454 [Liparis tanakae]
MQTPPGEAPTDTLSGTFDPPGPLKSHCKPRRHLRTAPLTGRLHPNATPSPSKPVPLTRSPGAPQPDTHIQNHGDASARLRGEELLLSHGHVLLAGGVLPAGDVLVVAHFGDDPADEPVDSTGLGAAVSGLRCRRGLAVLTGYGDRLLAAFLGSKLGLFFVQQFVDSVPTSLVK